jgi:hypothetical protein
LWKKVTIKSTTIPEETVKHGIIGLSGKLERGKIGINQNGNMVGRKDKPKNTHSILKAKLTPRSYPKGL